MSGQLQIKRPFGSSDKNDATFSDLLDQLPSAAKAEAAVRSARDAARAALEQKIRNKREEAKKKEKACGCW